MEIKKVFQRLREANLTLKPAKCKFLKKETEYLEHLINTKVVVPDPKKIEAVRTYPTPHNAKDMRAFLELAGFYRRFVPNFANLAKPLTELTKKDAKFQWTCAAEEAFQSLKTKLCESPVLAYPDFNKPFILSTDASGQALGAILSQIIDGQEHPIAYASRQLKPPEKNYSTTEREYLAVMFGIKYYRCYLMGKKFTIITDHRPLRWLLQLRDPSSRLARWALCLAEYEFDIQHRAGRKHGNADALSRQIAVLQYEPIWDNDQIKREQQNSEIQQL